LAVIPDESFEDPNEDTTTVDEEEEFLKKIL